MDFSRHFIFNFFLIHPPPPPPPLCREGEIKPRVKYKVNGVEVWREEYSQFWRRRGSCRGPRWHQGCWQGPLKHRKIIMFDQTRWWMTPQCCLYMPPRKKKHHNRGAVITTPGFHSLMNSDSRLNINYHGWRMGRQIPVHLAGQPSCCWSLFLQRYSPLSSRLAWDSKCGVLSALFGRCMAGATWYCCRFGAFCVHHSHMSRIATYVGCMRI